MHDATSTTAKRLGVVLEPLDTLFFRDGRPFEPATRAVSGMPVPQTLSGALRTALLVAAGIDLRKLASVVRERSSVIEALEALGAPRSVLAPRTRGPWFALQRSDGSVQPLVPVPATLARGPATKTWYRSDPLRHELPGWKSELGLEPLWRRAGDEAKPPGGFLSPEGLARFLDGGLPTDDHWYRVTDLWEVDHRTGIGIDAGTLTVQEGVIYAAGMISLVRKTRCGCRVVFYAELDVEDDAPLPVSDLAELGPLPFGGQSRYADVRQVDAFAWPSAPQRSSSGGALVVLTTPGLFSAGWMPACLQGDLLAAAVSEPIAVSGWDVPRGGPRPTRFAAPAGSVFFLKPECQTSTISDVISDDPEDRAQGWGTALKGEWTHVS